jgi:putative DNA primase/helicase
MDEPPRRTLSAAQAEALLRWSDGGTQRPPPIPDPACLYGLVGDVALEGSDGAETHPVAIAGNFIAYLSCAIGRMPYLAVGNTCHHPRLFFLHVGRSGRGRKGDAVSLVTRIDAAVRARRPELAPQIHRGGLSSREGLAALIHDGYRIGQQEVPPITDKRLWVVESEFANVLQQSRRGGNTLSAALRDCWDGVDLKPATKTNRVHASEPHVCLSGAISPVELLALVQRRDLLNGFVNRFLMVWGERTQIEAFPRRAPQARVEALAARVIDVLDFTRPRAEDEPEAVLMTLGEQARRRYAQLYLGELNQDFGGTLVDSLLERRAPMLLRLAMVFALSERQWRVEERHVEAALAWIRYATDSVGFVFAGGAGASQPQVVWAAERISAFLKAKGSASRRDLVVDCFGRHQPASVVDAAIAHLIDKEPGHVRVEVQARSRAGPGRPATVYRLVRPQGSN